MCIGGFNGVYVARVTRGSPAEKCIKKGQRINPNSYNTLQCLIKGVNLNYSFRVVARYFRLAFLTCHKPLTW